MDTAILGELKDDIRGYQGTMQETSPLPGPLPLLNIIPDRSRIKVVQRSSVN